jgi:hypothetical protein
MSASLGTRTRDSTEGLTVPAGLQIYFLPLERVRNGRYTPTFARGLARQAKKMARRDKDLLNP